MRWFGVRLFVSTPYKLSILCSYMILFSFLYIKQCRWEPQSCVALIMMNIHDVFSSWCARHRDGLLQTKPEHYCGILRNIRRDILHLACRDKRWLFLFRDPGTEISGHCHQPPALHRLHSQRYVCQQRRQEPAIHLRGGKDRYGFLPFLHPRWPRGQRNDPFMQRQSWLFSNPQPWQ